MDFNTHHQAEGRETRWLTPRHLIEPLGDFDLDPCGAPDYELAQRTYLLENGDDGLTDPWEGRIWLNPPYGRAAEPFVKRMAEHNHGTALIFARTETKLWHEYIWPSASGILFIKGRLTFLTPDQQKAGANAGAPSALVAYGKYDATKLKASGIPGAYISREDNA